MDRIIYGIEWVLVRNPTIGEVIETLADGNVMRGFASTTQESAPIDLVVYYWDDGARLHLDRVRRGGQCPRSDLKERPLGKPRRSTGASKT
jgi:hypothetical protein